MVVLSALVAFFASQFIVAVLSAAVLTLIGKSPSEIDALYSDDSYWPKVVVFFLVYAIMTALVFLIMRTWWKFEARDKKASAASKTKKQTHQLTTFKRSLHFLKLDKVPTLQQFFEVFAYYIMYLITMLFVGALVQLSGLVNVDQAQDLGVLPPHDASSIVAVAIIFVVLPPVCEEILFRGYLYNKLRQYAPLGLSVLLTSLLFGIAHLEYGNLNWIAAIDTFVFSMYLIFVSQKHGSLYSAILLHTLKNSLALALFITGVQATTIR